MNVTEKIRDPYIDIIKGIGIVSIVIGHAGWTIELAGYSIRIGPFVYLYHLAIFFFCSGYLYQDPKKNFWEFVVKKLKSLFVPFIGYTMLYLMFRNVFIDMGIWNGKKYDFEDWIISLTNMITFHGVGEFLAAFWFLPVLFFSVSLFAAVDFGLAHMKNDKFKIYVRCLCCIAFAALGIYTTEKGYGLLYNIQIAYLMVPVIAAGHLCAAYKYQLQKIVHTAGLVISALILAAVIKADIGIIELSQYRIINRYLFYPVTFCGIYFCLCLGKIIGKNQLFERSMAFIGRMSFDIMALHFLAFKLVDFAVCSITNQKQIMHLFPHSFDRIWMLYVIAGIAFPILMKKGYMKCKTFMTAKYSSRPKEQG